MNLIHISVKFLSFKNPSPYLKILAWLLNIWWKKLGTLKFLNILYYKLMISKYFSKYKIFRRGYLWRSLPDLVEQFHPQNIQNILIYIFPYCTYEFVFILFETSYNSQYWQQWKSETMHSTSHHRKYAKHSVNTIKLLYEVFLAMFVSWSIEISNYLLNFSFELEVVRHFVKLCNGVVFEIRLFVGKIFHFFLFSE